ncbi:hypothetical protein [Pseudomonas argentinensis]|uniref:hypothetical protein n=1 Tax=Phytopseudomonas argentinensis TaxID=289370 RepID=UPI0008A91E71|nr:hypothetical protein [Pseudomonas argentinensis]
MYPLKKVIISFTLCPVLVVIFGAFDFARVELLSQSSSMSTAEIFVAAFWLCVLGSLTSLLFYGLPALILSVIYASFRLYKCALHVFIVTMAGGFGALAWGTVLSMDINETFNFLSGAITSLVMAMYALPKKIIRDHTGDP